MMTRPDKQNYYIDIADTVSERSTCLRRRYGAIIVKDDEIVATGYNGAPRGRKNCTDIQTCERNNLGVPSGERYEICRSVHAEANAIISAGRWDCVNAVMYLSGRDSVTNEVLEYSTPCSMCRRMIINAGIRKVISRTPNGEIKTEDVRDWVYLDDSIKG